MTIQHLPQATLQDEHLQQLKGYIITGWPENKQKANFFCRIWITKENNVRFRGYFVSEKFKTFCRSLNIEQAFPLLYRHQSNGKVEANIKIVK